MTFKEKIQEFRKLVTERKDYVKSEEATKTSLVMPFFQQVLGYDIFSPTEFVPEHEAGWGEKPTDRVDYTIMIDSKPKIIVECKCSGVQLKNQHEAQLQGYFASMQSAKFAILTNGLVYQFYTDIERANILDKTPFMTFDALAPDASVICELERFCKEIFNADEIYNSASQLKYLGAVRSQFLQDLQSPSDKLVKYFMSCADLGKISTEKFRPIVKKSLNQTISEIMSDKINTALTADTEKSEASDSEKKENFSASEEELEAYFTVKEIMRSRDIPADRIIHRDYKDYVSVIYKRKNNIDVRICTLNFKNKSKFIMIPNGENNDEKYDIDEVYDIEQYADKIVEAPQRYQKVKDDIAEYQKRLSVENEVFAASKECVKDVIKPERLSLYRVANWSSVYFRNCVLCKIFTIDKDYCEIVFLEKFSDPKTNWKSRKHDITYSLSSVDEVPNYKNDFIASAKDIDASYDIIHQKK